MAAALSQDAQAVRRQVNFSQMGQNSTKDGLVTATTSKCVISVHNPSSSSQIYTIVGRVRSDGPPADGTWEGLVAGTTSSNVTIGVGSTFIYEWDYSTYPTSATVTTGTQMLSCSGYITVDDTNPANPGYLVASGAIHTFVESGSKTLTRTDGASSEAKGFAVQSQVPISINANRPF